MKAPSLRLITLATTAALAMEILDSCTMDDKGKTPTEQTTDDTKNAVKKGTDQEIYNEFNRLTDKQQEQLKRIKTFLERVKKLGFGLSPVAKKAESWIDCQEDNIKSIETLETDFLNGKLTTENTKERLTEIEVKGDSVSLLTPIIKMKEFKN